MSGQLRAIFSIAFMAAEVRKVISAVRIPPARSASASGSAWSAESMTITGMTGPSLSISRIVIGSSPGDDLSAQQGLPPVQHHLPDRGTGL